MKYSDKQILDWLSLNYFLQSKSEWDEMTLKEDTNIWRFYAPNGRAGDIRWVLEAAMERDGGVPE